MMILPYNRSLKDQVYTVWERSVAATHHFLKPEDFTFFKDIVKEIDFTEFNVFCAMDDEVVKGFLGVVDNKIEMLFVAPEYFGMGIGKSLLTYAMEELKATEVDVNEQNEKAVSFYKAYGFEPYGRTEKDSSGKDYPILKMKLILEDRS